MKDSFILYVNKEAKGLPGMTIFPNACRVNTKINKFPFHLTDFFILFSIL